MGLNNYLRPTNGEPVPFIQYNYGYCRELEYRLGDMIEWDGDRPDAAAGLVTIPGVFFEVEDGRSVGERFFEIKLISDKFIGFDEIPESEYKRRENASYDPRVG